MSGMKARTRATPEMGAYIAEHWGEKSPEDLAAELGISRATVYTARRRHLDALLGLDRARLRQGFVPGGHVPGIPTQDLTALLDVLVGDSLRRDPGDLARQLSDGFGGIDLQPEHVATLARIAAGEGYEHRNVKLRRRADQAADNAVIRQLMDRPPLGAEAIRILGQTPIPGRLVEDDGVGLHFASDDDTIDLEPGRVLLVTVPSEAT